MKTYPKPKFYRTITLSDGKVWTLKTFSTVEIVATKMPPKKKNVYTGRDWLKVELIKGATKANIQKDLKKEENKRKARKKVTEEEE